MLGDPVGKQGLDPTVEVWGEKQLGYGGLEMLLVILVLIKWLTQLYWNILCMGRDRRTS